MMLVTIILSEIVVTMFLLTLIFRYASFPSFRGTNYGGVDN